MIIDLDFAELHAPLFFGGRNFGLKLETAGVKHRGLILRYDRAEKELLVSFDGKEAVVPVGNVACMVAKKAAQKVPEVKAPSPELARSRSAQVSSPQSHVHAGLGHGQTGQEEKGKVVL